jgi:hypothetical protein
VLQIWKRLHAKYPLSLSHFNEIWRFSIDFPKKPPNIKFHKNPSSGSRVVPCERTDRQTDRRTDITKLIVAFHNFEKEYKNRNCMNCNMTHAKRMAFWACELNAVKTCFVWNNKRRPTLEAFVRHTSISALIITLECHPPPSYVLC